MEDLHSIGFDEITQAFAFKKYLKHCRNGMYPNPTHGKTLVGNGQTIGRNVAIACVTGSRLEIEYEIGARHCFYQVGNARPKRARPVVD